MTTPADPPYLSLVPRWTVRGSREIARTCIFTLHSRRCESPTDPVKAGDFACLECPDWANVVAITPDRRIVMVEQYRFGLDAVTLEIPGGVVDDGEDPAETCRRELLEETGYGPEDGRAPEIIGRVSANPAMQGNRVHTGLIRRAVRTAEVKLDANEEIGVRLVPLREIPGLIRDGTIHHSFVVAAFHYLALATPDAFE